MQSYKVLKKQTVTRRRCHQQNRCVFSNRRNSRKVCPESRRRRGRGCSTDVGQQQSGVNRITYWSQGVASLPH